MCTLAAVSHGPPHPQVHWPVTPAALVGCWPESRRAPRSKLGNVVCTMTGRQAEIWSSPREWSAWMNVAYRNYSGSDSKDLVCVFSGHLDHVHVDEDCLLCLVSGCSCTFQSGRPVVVWLSIVTVTGGCYFLVVSTAEQRVDGTKHCRGFKSRLLSAAELAMRPFLCLFLRRTLWILLSAPGIHALVVYFSQTYLSMLHNRVEAEARTAGGCRNHGNGICKRVEDEPRGRSVSALIALHCAARLDGDGTHPEQTWRCLVEPNLGYGQIWLVIKLRLCLRRNKILANTEM